MKPFRFTLEAVSTIRKRAERETLEAYAQSLLLRGRALERRQAIQRGLEAAWTRTRQESAKGCSASTISQLQGYTRLLEEECARCQAALQQAVRAVNQSLQRMLAARQQREVVDTFRRHQRARYDLEFGRETQKFLDELTSRKSQVLSLASKVWRRDAGDVRPETPDFRLETRD